MRRRDSATKTTKGWPALQKRGGTRQRRPGFALTSWDDRLRPHRRLARQGICRPEGVAVLYGKWKSFKTFAALTSIASPISRPGRLQSTHYLRP